MSVCHNVLVELTSDEGNARVLLNSTCWGLWLTLQEIDKSADEDDNKGKDPNGEALVDSVATLADNSRSDPLPSGSEAGGEA